ncbi:alpha/beta hydrolase [Subsaximicrobium wynnwilliamsii]|uniref:Alpha/beta hydrolase n=1 Tax=Subsaximicrobium wynnwilliamsii TaxID=291179 RepID=A0A5C6ZL24_9FLAO|nr:alpha/beta hydrolase [Subsaximicrobium wynnwilliamsii]TXD81624.1 alpha/beta hydrolase [Subsaximicrobium wynnwilliamsii]TXD91048.1 alpha/beta hydrolase [Subsaximicrobium wynnwilliamsii]TXE01073.1 alpha/beta hydrolase [Subsaximicrobium wynnwilliamsii]
MTTSIRIATLILMTISTTSSFGLIRETHLLETSNPKPFIVETIGQGKPILYLPGFATPGSVWKETVESLNLERKSHLFSYAGFNGNAPIAMPWYSSIKKAIIEYIIVNDMSNLIIVGHSMGGNLAVDIASEIPSRVSKIIIVEALPCMREVMMPNVPAESLYYDSPYNKQMLEMDAQQFKNMATMMASNMTLIENKKDIITNWILEADRETWVYGYTDLLKLDLRTSLSKVTCETLILGASFPDVKIAKAHYENQYSNLSNKKILMATNSKHFLMFDQAEWFYKTVNDFLVHEKK